MKQSEEKGIKPATFERNAGEVLSQALAHCEKASERCIRISVKMSAAAPTSAKVRAEKAKSEKS